MRHTLRSLFPLLALLLLASAVLYRSPFSASNLEVEPDSVEYAVGAERLASLGRYDIVLEGTAYPPRYPPWFSLLLSPAYKFGNDLGDGIRVVFAFALLGVAAAWFIGSAVSGPWGGLLAGLSLLAIPEYRHLSRLVMTDVPACALALSGCALFLAQPETPLFFLGGLAAALAAALRPLLIALLLPFALAAASSAEKRRDMFLACAPAALVVLFSALYNARVFGSPWRNGYDFWCPVPYDYPSLVLSAAYLPRNLRDTFGAGALALFALAAAAALLLRRDAARRPAERPAAERFQAAAGFAVLATGPLVAFHLFYFFQSPRFPLAPEALAAVLVCADLGPRLRRVVPERLALAVPAVLLAAALAYRARSVPAPPVRRLRAEMMALRTPNDALIITELNLAYLEPLVLRGTRRRALPLGRGVEYADKQVAWKTISDLVPQPRSAFDQRGADLLAAGAQEAVPFVACERLGALAAEVARGTPVFMDTAYLPPDDAPTAVALAKRFRLQPVGPAFYRLLPR